MKRPMSSQIAELQQSLTIEKSLRIRLEQDNAKLQERIKQIAAENESLQGDKKWLKSLSQNLMEIMQRSVIKER